MQPVEPSSEKAEVIFPGFAYLPVEKGGTSSASSQ